MGREIFDVVVVGLGHAGAEAALAAVRLGARVGAVTQVAGRACLMSCNPAIGGSGKSQLVREIDAMGGAMASAADSAALQVRRLNRSKGPAGWATRLQVDRRRYAVAMQSRLRAAGLSILEGEVSGLSLEGGRVTGLSLLDGSTLSARAVIVTAGTFLAARMHVGSAQREGGRVGDRSSDGLAATLRALGLRVGRFKTGTPPRLEGRTIDWSRCEEQKSEADVGPLARSSRPGPFPALPQRSTFLTATGEDTHAVVRAAVDRSPLSTGAIVGRGPRYCPSLEQKVLGYPERRGHLVYLEPDGLETSEVYPAGLSTSLPADVQTELLRTIPGLEQVEIRQPGYAVEYDYLTPGQLRGWLEHAEVAGLFFAGQINGSSGYEEAAGQGLVAGVNAVRVAARGEPPWVPDRAGSYLGVLCDDLVNGGFDEPYRVLPGRSEHRMRLREDNAEQRLSPLALDLGLISAAWAAPVLEQMAEVARVRERLTEDDERWLRNPERAEDVAALRLLDGETTEASARQVVRDVRYAPYEQQREIASSRLGAALDAIIPSDLILEAVVGLSAEAREAIVRHRPGRLREAVGLPGVGDASLALLAAHLRRRAKGVPRGTSR